MIRLLSPRINDVNVPARNLTDPVRTIAKLTTVDIKGEIPELKNTNKMVDQLNSFAAMVAHVARDVGTEGKLGGRAVVKRVSGSGKISLTNFSFMASTSLPRYAGFVQVVTAVANGDLSPKLEVATKGECLQSEPTCMTKS